MKGKLSRQIIVVMLFACCSEAYSALQNENITVDKVDITKETAIVLVSGADLVGRRAQCEVHPVLFPVL